MFSHFFTRNWVRWTAIKYLQAHFARAICVPPKRARPIVCLDQIVRSTPRKAPIVAAVKVSRPTQTPKLKMARTSGAKPAFRAHLAAVAPYERWDSVSASYVPLRADERVSDERLHVSIKRSRPAAVRLNGGLRGSAATKWR